MIQIPSIEITPEGLEDLRRELKDLENVKRPHAVDRLTNARSMGDLAENSDYIQGKEELAMIDGRISELRELVSHSKIIRSNHSAAVGLGSTVTVKVNGSKQVFEIVGEWEANPSKSKISHQSPLGQALMGKKVGEEVHFSAPVGTVHYTIAEIK
jgi:transcription elongation factor GreA